MILNVVIGASVLGTHYSQADNKRWLASKAFSAEAIDPRCGRE